MRRQSLLLLFIICQAMVLAQYPPVAIPGSQIRKIQSTIVNQEYELQILLPGGYAKSDKKFPVVYLMDAQWDFPLVKSIYGQHYYDGFIPEMIIVGITWGGKNPNPDSLRVRDYTPTKEQWAIQSGGADKFLDFMNNELFPFMEANYKVDKEERMLMGCSLGGLLTLYALFTHTNMFTGYAAASPAIGWDAEVLYQYEKEFSAKKISKPVRVYMTMGDVERNRAAYEKFAALLTSRAYKSVSIRSKVLENTGHSGTKSETYARGLQYIFEKPKLTLPSEELNKYIGKYQFANGSAIEIKNENNQLVVYFSPGNKFELFAATATSFYSDAEYFKAHFSFENNKLEGLVLERYGRTDTLKKIK